MEIETKTASLDTLAVTIRALHVNGKQMTLAVFRQLPTIDAFNADGSLAPVQPWGLVRYQVKDGPDIWIVCEHGQRLYRADLFFEGCNQQSKRHAEYAAEDARRSAGAVQRWNRLRARIPIIPVKDGPNEWTHDSWWCRCDACRQIDSSDREWFHKNKIEDLQQRLAESAGAAERYKRAFATAEALLRLPQLFIAV